jgi:hypothetical protein
MGISGHILGPRKLRRLQRETGLPFDRAYNRNGVGAARIVDDAGCHHYWIDFRDYRVEPIDRPTHWSSCPTDPRLRQPPTPCQHVVLAHRPGGWVCLGCGVQIEVPND